MLSIIVAIAENNAIGKDNDLLWRLPKDLARFKEITTTESKTIIMGRKTFESLSRVLPGRKHIVLTKNQDFKVEAESVEIMHSTEELKPLIDAPEEYFVIGGGEIYSLLLPYTNKMYITEVHKSFEAHAYFPQFYKNQWRVLDRSEEYVDEKSSLRYSYVTYIRDKGTGTVSLFAEIPSDTSRRQV
jgi:dihydrofolate reductase